MSSFEYLKQIREIYAEVTPEILRRGRLAPTFFDWDVVFSPIERETWGLIRSMGLPLYPQYPVLQYFLDFANPVHRVGLEVDGKQWHADRERDTERDQRIVQSGWHVYRCTGSEVKRVVEQYERHEEEEVSPTHDYLHHTVEGVLEAIACVYFSWPSSEVDRSRYEESLSRHRLVWFEIGRSPHGLD